ncbi:flagella assembly protein FlgT [Glaciecola petra]|uniref:Flagellar assembly protein T N-terminal domain-containing protein n=1 Tax=Glaciecola petra TaxID=3075602 RepID=A0ABU2ZMC7_9ALTE|nr:flagellar assembly protein T N-terminal domain-containing protein [Aestuariibacter sp. P117]MDT0593776.1 flagellar assembly protein T N-terminal domain-containing protein [Aestuariibacter sp. P117]
MKIIEAHHQHGPILLKPFFLNILVGCFSFIRLSVISCGLLLIASTSNAAWFSATGQAVVVNGNKEAARKEATEEAIKQALLFAGASVRSVSQMTNGLLMDEHLEIRANGEVNTIQLIDEVYQDGLVTVSIRADIFAQDAQCSAADYTKKIATTYFPVQFQAQAADGQIQDIGKVTALKLQSLIDKITTSVEITHVAPYVFDWHMANVPRESQALANKTNTQYIVNVVLNDISVDRYERAGFNPFKTENSIRSFDFTLSLVDGATGEELYRQSYESKAPWDFQFTDSIDVASDKFWRSQYGKNIKTMLQQGVTDLEEFAICQPTMGRVLAVANNQLQINLGRSHQVQQGDQLTLFNVKQITDNFGQEYRQFVLHPTTLVVRQVYNDTATVEAADRSLLGDVQPNDYVARQ